MHIIEHYGSGMRRMKNGCPYPTMKSGNGEFRITFSARTKESVAKLGMPPEKFGISFFTTEIRSDARRNMIAILDCLAYDNLMNN